MAHGRGGLEPGCVIHSDRGSEYTSAQFRDLIRELRLRQSCGRTGSCVDNAAAESFWALLKEEIGTRTWPDRATARAEVFTFIETFTTVVASASTRPSATSPRPRPGSDTNTPSRHNRRVSKIAGKLHPAAAPAHDARSRGGRHRRRPEGQSSDRGRASAGGPQGCRHRPPHRRRKSGVPPRISVPTRHPGRSPGRSSAVEPDHPRSPTGSCEVHRKPRRGRVTTWGPCPDGARSAGRRVTGARRKPVPCAVLCDSGEVHVAAPHVGLV
ncbi:hypothetical protein [Streptomyces ossamyceticus]|uniref:hypothetical protein n=1 Tax=Streptomyces ossamyceticus TaxID=249581 RepID=UPI00341AB1EC